MTDTVIIAIVGGAVSLLSLLATLFVKYKLEKVHKQINSRMDELLELTRVSSKAEGVKEEKEKSNIALK